jgi:putative oligomerization/nucleic acid binding protein
MTPPPTPAPAPAPSGPPDQGTGRAVEALRSLLIPGEELQSWAIQHRLFALTHRRQIVGATSGRLLAVARGLLGGFTTEDIRWQDLDDAQLRVGIIGATLTVVAFASTDLASASPGTARTLVFAGLRKAEAQAVYRTCQAQEQAWREKRRVRDLEELRAKSGGIQLSGGAPAVPGGGDEARQPAARLQRAREMLQQGLLTDAEFEQIKSRILGDL